jgi:hypothetical protein
VSDVVKTTINFPGEVIKNIIGAAGDAAGVGDLSSDLSGLLPAAAAMWSARSPRRFDSGSRHIPKHRRRSLRYQRVSAVFPT